MTHQCVDCEEGVFTKRKKKQVKSDKIGKDITQYLHSKEMKGGKDEVEFKIQQVILCWCLSFTVFIHQPIINR